MTARQPSSSAAAGSSAGYVLELRAVSRDLAGGLDQPTSGTVHVEDTSLGGLSRTALAAVRRCSSPGWARRSA